MSKQTVHSFNVEDAEKYGVECAVLLYNIRYWLRKNKANEKHIHEGRVWTYNSTKAFSELFPYLSESQIYRRLKKLEDENILLTGNFNKHNYDQTKWYSVNEVEFSNLRNRKMEDTESENDSSKTEEPIPDVNTDLNSDKESARVNGVPIPEPLLSVEGFKEKYEFYCRYLQENHNRWPTATTTETDLQTLLRLKKEGNDPIKVIDQTIQSRNKSFFKLRDFDNDKDEPKMSYHNLI